MKKQCILAALSMLVLVTTTLHAEWNPFKRQDKERKMQARKAVIATAALLSIGAITLEILNVTGHVKAGDIPLHLSLLASLIANTTVNESKATYVWQYIPWFPVYTPTYTYIPPIRPLHIQFNF
ncbi:MAG: hypothetical protein M1114_04165 [Candidatus Dependentiae bacterium]|nr:hypothetical protein [Candidatus Dependentiae bacterium]